MFGKGTFSFLKTLAKEFQQGWDSVPEVSPEKQLEDKSAQDQQQEVAAYELPDVPWLVEGLSLEHQASLQKIIMSISTVVNSKVEPKC